ncbi:MAG TPA: hypothetical protein VM261_16865 [Kofleriaceae bacterium]|nr:hypothetical protein [Kofleriaceae bacterium]
MKRLSTTILALALCCVAADAWAVPATLSFTGRLSTANGPVNGNVGMTFALFAQATGGTAVWTETRPSVMAEAGLVYAELGGLTTLDETVITDAPLFLEIRIGNETLVPRLPLQSVPYAIRAEVANSADTLGTIEPDDVVTGLTAGAGIAVARNGNAATLGLAPCAAGQVLKAGAGGAWTCAADVDTDTNTTYTASNGVALNGSVFGLAPCSSGQVLKAGAGGTWTCAADTDTDTNTTYSAAANSGVALSGTAFGLTTCASGQVLKAGATGGTWACAADASTTYSAGSGITLNGTTFATDNTVVARKDSAAGTQTFDGGTMVWDYTSNRIGIGTVTPQEALDVAAPVRLDTMRLFRKYGNNGTASCTDFCRSAGHAGGTGNCVSARTTGGTYIDCSFAPGLGQDPICMCAGF